MTTPTRRWRSRSARSRASRRSPSGGQQKARDPYPDRSRQTGRQEPATRRRPQPDRDHHRGQPQGQYRRSDAQLHHLRQRPVTEVQRLERRHRCPIATAARCASATSARRCPVRKTPSRPRGPTASAACSSWSSSSPAPTSSTRSTRSRRNCPASSRRFRRRSSLGAQRPHADHSRSRRGCAVHAAAHHRPRGHGDLRLPAQRLGDDHSGASPCRWRCSAPAR